MATQAAAERNPLRIEQMTIFDIEPAEVVSLAASLSVPLVSFWTTDAIEGARPVTAANRKDVLARLADAPVAVDTVEVFDLAWEPAKAEPGLALAAELGAKAIVAINLVEADEARAAEQLARLGALAAGYGMLVSVEPIYMGATRSPADGLRLVQASGAANARLTIDILHVFRSGTSAADIAALPPGIVSSTQICDGLATVTPEQMYEEGAHNRLPPGEGAFPVEAFLRAIPPAPLGVEIPMRALRERGVSARERTILAVEATRRAQARAAG